MRLAAFFNVKVQKGFLGRRKLSHKVQAHYRSANILGPRFLVHVASYGELEQAKPVISEIRKQYPSAHIHLTFFSPSGYENTIGKYPEVDFISYSPIDRRKDVRDFLDSAKPDIVLFARYDVWPNIAVKLQRRNIPTILFAATAAESSGRTMPFARALHAKVYQGLTRIFVISEEDRARFVSMGVSSERLVVAGDTRYDRVLSRKAAIETSGELLLPVHVIHQIEEKHTLVFVVGSSWPKDEAIIEKTLKESIARKDNILTIIVPHEPTTEHVDKLLSTYAGNAIRLSDLGSYAGEHIVIADSIGKLFGLYRHADIAMIGGGFSNGLHNILEAAVWGVPAIVGPNHRKSQEVQPLIDVLIAFEVTSAQEFDFVFWRLLQDNDLRESTGQKARQFVEARRGATAKVLSEIELLLK